MPKRKTKKRGSKFSVLNFFKNWFFSLRKTYKVFVIVLTIILFGALLSYLASVYYVTKHRNQPVKIGTTFVPNYAKYFGLDPEQTYDAIVDDLDIKRLRLVSYWSNIEKKQGTYDYSELDWQFKKAEEKNLEITLSIGLRQPRWPECHMPTWAMQMDKKDWQPRLYDFIENTVKRYKDSPVLQSYQLENEYFLAQFGECPDHSRERLVEEFDLVKNIDPGTPIIISRSNNWWGAPIGEPVPDQYALSIYKRVWDKTVTQRYLEYPYPPWYYSALAGFSDFTQNRSMIIHELQTEAWLPGGYEMNNPDHIPEMDKTLSADNLDDRIQYGVDSGIKTIDLWGAEWWYWRMVKADDPSLWNVAKDKIAEVKRTND